MIHGSPREVFPSKNLFTENCSECPINLLAISDLPGGNFYFAVCATLQ